MLEDEDLYDNDAFNKRLLDLRKRAGETGVMPRIEEPVTEQKQTAPIVEPVEEVAVESPKPAPKIRSMGVPDILRTIRMVETGDGANMKHQLIDDPKSMHYGTRAIGRYGFMPTTVADLYKRGIIKGNKLAEQIIKTPKEDWETHLKLVQQMPDEEDRMAEALVRGMLQRGLRNPIQIHNAWMSGSEITEDAFKPGGARENYLKKEYLKNNPQWASRVKNLVKILKENKK